MICTCVFSDTDITSADVTAILTFVQSTLTGSYTVNVLEVSNAGHLLLKIV